MSSTDTRKLQFVAELFSVLGDPVRLRILNCLREGPLCVNEIHQTCRLKQANTSKHLRVLREAGVVKAKRAGTSVIYEVSEPLVLQLCDIVCRRKS